VRLYRDGLAETFARESGFDVVATASTAADALARAAETEPDVALVDIEIHEAATLIRDIGARAKVIALAVRRVDEDVIRLAESGVAGYVTSEQSLEELIAAVRSVAAGETACEPWIATTLLRRVAELAGERPHAETTRLTAREHEIVGLLDQGLSNKEIASRLRIELATVKNHVHNILEKLNVRRRADAGAAARNSGARGASGRPILKQH